MAVLRKHAHQRVSFAARSGTTLLPVTLKQTNYPTTAGEIDPGVTGTETISSGTTANSVAYITGSSASMPTLQVEIANGSLSGMNVKWWMTVTSERPERGTKDNLQIPSLVPGYVTVPINQPWEIDDYYYESFGGVCTIHYVIQDPDGNALTPAEQFSFLIRGKNPPPSVAYNYIQSEGGTTYYYAWGIAKWESYQPTYNATYNQFNAGGPLIALPNYSADGADGWGIFQRDDTEGGIYVDTNQVYSWKINSDVSIQQELPEKWQNANGYLTGLQTAYPTQYNQDPPPSYTTGNGIPFSAQDTLTIERYNGAHGRTNAQLLIFVPSNPPGTGSGKRWMWNLPVAEGKGNTVPYIDLVAEGMTSTP